MLALLAYIRHHHVSMLIDAIVNIVVVIFEVPSLVWTKNNFVVIAISNTVCYALHLGATIWLGVVVLSVFKNISFPPNFIPVQYLIALASLLTMGSSITLTWIEVSRRGKQEEENLQELEIIDNVESMQTVIQSEKLTRKPKNKSKSRMHLDKDVRLRIPLITLNNKASERTLVVSTVSMDDDGTLNMILQASLADSALYDEGSDNWMNPKPIKLSYSVPHLSNLLRPLLSVNTDPEKKDMKTWNSQSDLAEDFSLARSSSTSQLRIKKLRLARHQWLTQEDRLLCVQEGLKEINLGNKLEEDISPDGTIKVHEQATPKGYESDIPLADHTKNQSPQFPHRNNGANSPVLSDSISRSSDAVNESPTRLLGMMDGLEDIPRPASRWNSDNDDSDNSDTPTVHHTSQGIKNVSLEQWEANKLAWLSQSHSARPVLYGTTSSGALSRSVSAPSLHTYRQISDGNTTKSSDFGSLDATFTHFITPVVTPVQENPIEHHTGSSSPIKKMIGIFKRRESMIELGNADLPHTHKHTQSVANSLVSFLTSLTSGKSSRSNSPRKSIKSLFSPSTLHEQAPPLRLVFPHSAPYNLHKGGHHKSMSLNSKLLPGFQPTQLSGIKTVEYSEESRVSSIPSAIVGEYDKEKWRTLKELERQAEIDMAHGEL